MLSVCFMYVSIGSLSDFGWKISTTDTISHCLFYMRSFDKCLFIKETTHFLNIWGGVF